ncbi:MAG: type 1 glutamine amidotransferase [Candidatus Omnitrophota bacterium]|nr:type 1 glutamine amidotransferase [Candidatus Omnitrophota bacterium]
MVLIIKHVAIEGPGTLGEFFEDVRKKVKTVELWKGEKLPASFTDVEAVLILGGPMNVYEEDKFPFLKEEDVFLKNALRQDIPVLGICLGAQLLAKATGARVTKAEQEEIGWYNVNLTESGIDDRLFGGAGRQLRVFQWHGDTFEIPKGAKLLASSPICRNQAFRIGKYSYGLQFHVEVTEEIIKRWEDEYFDSRGASLKIQRDTMTGEHARSKEKFIRQARQIYLNFLNIIEGKK